MRAVRNYVDAPLSPGLQLALPEATVAHLVRVLRLGIGDDIVLFNGDGNDYAARLVSVGKRSAVAEVIACIPVASESPLQITLAQGIARGEKMDLILQKATELGVHRVVPVITERTEVKLDGDRCEKKLQHWNGVLAAACEQSGRARLPTLDTPMALDRFAASAGGDRRLILDPHGATSLAGLALSPRATVTILIGPEGGLSPRDLTALDVAGFERIRLGPRVLRTETAGLAAIAALNALYGDWN